MFDDATHDELFYMQAETRENVQRESD
ncbi:hypothetical protein [Aggregatibacter actinomycetemcomitans]